METENKSKLGNRIFYTIFILLIIGSVGCTFWRIVIQKDYQIVADVSCDPATESCFHYEPEPCAMEDYGCLALPPEEAYDYKIMDLGNPLVDEIEKNFELFKLIYKLYEIEHPTTEPKFTSYPTTIKL